MVKEFIFMQMEIDMKENGNKIENMEMENISIQKKMNNMMVNGSMEKNKGLDLIIIAMEIYLEVIGKKTKEMEKVFQNIHQEQDLKENLGMKK